MTTMTDRLSPQHEAEIRERADAATAGPWTCTRMDSEISTINAGNKSARLAWMRDASEPDTNFIAHSRKDIDVLLTELATVRAERDEARAVRGLLARALGERDAELAKYVGHEPTIAEEMAYLRSCLDAVRTVCDEADKQAKQWVDAVRRAAEGNAS